MDLGGGNSNIFWNVHPENWGNDSHFDSYFSVGLKPPTRLDSFLLFGWSVVGGIFIVGVGMFFFDGQLVERCSLLRIVRKRGGFII